VLVFCNDKNGNDHHGDDDDIDGDDDDIDGDVDK